MNKSDFLRNDLIKKIKSIDPEEKPKWGLMNVQQMVEHLSDSVREANGRVPKTLITPSDKLLRVKEFMMSEKPFKENTKNVQMPAIPAPVKRATMDEALDELQTELMDFFKVFENEPKKTITNPFFGDLNFNEWVHLLHKHTIHHLRQFGVE